MKILYAIQATGNGHISRAREIIPYLSGYGELHLLVSGRQADMNLPFLVRYKKPGISFTFGKKGGVDMIDSVKHFRPFNFIRDIYSFPVETYDLIINDFEPVTAWACRLKNKPCIGLSHQSAYLSEKTPRPEKRDAFAEWLLRHYAPVTDKYSFHFRSFDHFIHTPVVRSEVRRMETLNRGHITVYLPAHGDDLLYRAFSTIKDVRWDVFSKHTKMSSRRENVSFTPVNNEAYINSLATGDGLITAGGFEGPAEALHLRKKIMVIPMNNQYEQQCNAVALKDLGVSVVKKIDEGFEEKLRSWLNFGFPPNIFYPDQTGKIIEKLVTSHAAC